MSGKLSHEQMEDTLNFVAEEFFRRLTTVGEEVSKAAELLLQTEDELGRHPAIKSALEHLAEAERTAALLDVWAKVAASAHKNPEAFDHLCSRVKSRPGTTSELSAHGRKWQGMVAAPYRRALSGKTKLGPAQSVL